MCRKLLTAHVYLNIFVVDACVFLVCRTRCCASGNQNKATELSFEMSPQAEAPVHAYLQMAFLLFCTYTSLSFQTCLQTRKSLDRCAKITFVTNISPQKLSIMRYFYISGSLCCLRSMGATLLAFLPSSIVEDPVYKRDSSC